MKTYISFADSFTKLLDPIIESDFLHARWLNTLSYLENCGARKIAACEHPTLVPEEMLKHASEEFRHAHSLKWQIERVSPEPLESYDRHSILGGRATLHYLNALDLYTSQYLKNEGFDCASIKKIAYLLVTYAIELRAEELYPIYNTILRSKRSLVTVTAIVLEEKEHLEEMRQGLAILPFGQTHADHICSRESLLCSRWIEAIKNNIKPSLKFPISPI